MSKWRRSAVESPIQVYGDRDLITQKLSPNQSVYIDVVQERSQVFEHKHPDSFNSSARTDLTEQTYGEKSWGHRPFWDFIFEKPLFPIAICTKTGMLFGQHFDGELPTNLNHVFLRQFENGFNKKVGMFMFKNQNDGATLSAIWKFFRLSAMCELLRGPLKTILRQIDLRACFQVSHVHWI